MKDLVARNLVILFISVWTALFGFYGFLAYRAHLWSPLWAIQPTTKSFTERLPLRPSSEGTSQIEQGRLAYRELRCGVCHGPNGEGGVKNPNADPDSAVPNLFDLEEAFTWNDLIEKIRKGAHPAKMEDDKPEPPLDMPAWMDIISEEELESLAHYLFSLKSSEVKP